MHFLKAGLPSPLVFERLTRGYPPILEAHGTRLSKGQQSSKDLAGETDCLQV